MFVSKKNLEDDFRSLDEKIEDIQALVTEEIQNNTTAIDNNIKWLNSSITIYRTQLNDLEDRICLLEECETDIPNSNKTVKISEIYDKISINERKVADLRSRFTEYKNASEDVQDKTKIALDEIKMRIECMEESTRSLVEMIEHHKNEKQDLNIYNKELINLNSQMTKQISDLKSQLKECNQKILIQDDSMSRMQELIKNIYKEITTLKETNKLPINPNLSTYNKPLQPTNTSIQSKPQVEQPKIEETVEQSTIYDKHLEKPVEKKKDVKIDTQNTGIKDDNNTNVKLSPSQTTQKFIIPEMPSRIVFGKNETIESIQRKVQELSNLDNIINCVNVFDNSSKNRYLKCLDNYKNKLTKNMSEIDLKSIPSENVSAVIAENFFKIISANIIDVFIPLLYTIIRNGRGETRENHFLLLEEMNKYLEKCCIYTKSIPFDDIPNQRILEMMNVNRTFTKNPNLAQKISEIKLLPYCMNYIGIDGKKAILLKKGVMSVYKG